MQFGTSRLKMLTGISIVGSVTSLTRAGCTGEQDLRSKLGQRQGFRTGNQARAGNNVDLRDKLSGLGSQNRQTVPANEVPRAQRRVASVVFNSSTVTRGVASTTAPAPVSARATATVKKPSDVPMVHNLVLLILKSQSRKFHAFRSQVRVVWPSCLLRKFVGFQVLYCTVFFHVL